MMKTVAVLLSVVSVVLASCGSARNSPERDASGTQSDTRCVDGDLGNYCTCTERWTVFRQGQPPQPPTADLSKCRSLVLPVPCCGIGYACCPL